MGPMMALSSSLESFTTDNSLSTDIARIITSGILDSTNASITSNSPPVYLIIYATSLMLTSCLGTFGNILVICSVLLNKKLRVLQSVFTVNLAIADLLVTTLMLPFSFVGIYFDLDIEEFFLQNNGLCELLGTVCVACCASSILSIASISVNRYVFICHRLIYPKIYSKRSVPFMVASIWVSALLLDLPNYTGWGNHVFDKRNYICNYDFSADYSYTYFLLCVGLGTPTCVMTYCYVHIYLLARRSAKRVHDHAASAQPNNKRPAIRGDDKRLLKTILTIWMVFLLCWSPYGLIILSGLGDIPWLFLPSVALLLANSSINFIIYATNKNFRDGYAIVLSKVCPCKCLSQMLQGAADDSDQTNTSNVGD